MNEEKKVPVDDLLKDVRYASLNSRRTRIVLEFASKEKAAAFYQEVLNRKPVKE